MAEVTKEYATQVLHQLELKGNDMAALGKQLGPLSAEEQKQFFASAGEKLGMHLSQAPSPAIQPSAMQAFQAGNPNARFQPDKAIGAIETTFRTARNQSLMGFGEQAVEAASRGIAKINPMISKEQYQETFANKSISESIKPAQAELQTGQSAHPGAELLGTAVGEAAGWGASEGVMRGIAMTLRPVKAAAGAVGELVKGGLDSTSAKIAGSIPKLTQKWVGKIGGEKALQELGQFLNDSGVTSIIGTTKRVANKVANVKNAIGEEIGKIWTKAGTKSANFAMDADALAQSTTKYVEEAQSAAKMTVKDTLAQDILTELAQYKKTLFDAEGKVSIDGARKVIKTLETESGKFLKSDAAKASFLDLVSDGMRNVLKDEVGIFLPAVEREALSTLNRQYVLAKIADRGMQAKLSESLLSKYAKKSLAGYVGGEVGGYVGGEEGKKAGQLIGFGATTTLGKTAASSLLRLVPELGSYGKILLRTAHTGGLDALLARHAYMYMNNENYRNMLNDLGGLNQDQR